GATQAQRTEDGGHTWTTQLNDDRTAPENHLSLADVRIDDSGAAVTFANILDDNFLNVTGNEVWLLPADGSAAQRGQGGPGGVAPIYSMCVVAGGVGVAAGSFRFSMALVAVDTVFVSADAGSSWKLDPQLSTTNGAVSWGGTACNGASDLWVVGTSSTGG